MKTLSDVMPQEFISQYEDDCKALKYKDVQVVKEFFMSEKGWLPWEGKHKNVYFWVVLSNGKAVGMNENPSRGLSFPVISYKKLK